jgi:hypothetical protein
VFLFVTVFLLGLDQALRDGRRGGIGTFIEWLNTPFVWLLDWATKQDLMASDNLLIGSIGYLIYWAFLGAVLSLGTYCLVRQIRKLIHRWRENRGA